MYTDPLPSPNKLMHIRGAGQLKQKTCVIRAAAAIRQGGRSHSLAEGISYKNKRADS